MSEEFVGSGNGKKSKHGYDNKGNANFSIDYTIDKNQSLSFVYQYSKSSNRSNNNRDIMRTQWYDDPSIADTTFYNELSRKKTQEGEHSLAVFYRRYKGTTSVTTDLNFRYNSSKSLNDYNRSTGYYIENHFRDAMNFLRYRLSASGSIVPEKLSINGSYILTWKDYKRRDNDQGNILNQNYYLRNNISAGLTYTPSRNTTYSMSFWTEHILAESNKQKIKQKMPVGGSFMFFHRLSRRNWFRLNYNCSVSYPDQSLSSSYGYFVDSLTWIGGNPALKTNVTHNVSFWIDLWNCFNFQAGAVFVPNQFNSIVEVREGELLSGKRGEYVASTYQNTNYTEWWTSVSVTKRLWRDFLFKADAKLRRAKSSYAEFSNHVIGGFFKTSLSYYWQKHDMNLYAAYSYDRSIAITPQSFRQFNEEGPYISLEKYWLNKRLNVNVTYQWIFNIFPNAITTEAKSPAIITKITDPYGQRHKHTVAIRIIYRFAGGKSVRRYNREMSSER